MTNDILLDLWKTKTSPPVTTVWLWPISFLSWVRSLDTGNSANFNARFESYNRHRDACETCAEH
jgi:hypothetical protein